MRFLRKISTTLTIAEQSGVIIILSLMVILAFAQVVLRNFFSSGIIWGDIFLRHLVLWLAFLGASLAAERGKHISIDLVGRFVTGKTATAIHVITNLFATVISFYLARAGWVFLRSEIETGDILLRIGNQPVLTWWLQVIIPVGFGLMSFHFLLRTIEHVIILIRPPQNTQEQKSNKN